MAHYQQQSLSIAAVMLANEKMRCDEKTIFKRLMHIAIDENCINKGCQADAFFAVALNVRCRAPSLHRKLLAIGPADAKHPQINGGVGRDQLKLNRAGILALQYKAVYYQYFPWGRRIPWILLHQTLKINEY